MFCFEIRSVRFNDRHGRRKDLFRTLVLWRKIADVRGSRGIATVKVIVSLRVCADLRTMVEGSEDDRMVNRLHRWRYGDDGAVRLYWEGDQII